MTTPVRDTEVCIVGAGVMGCAAALELTERGLHVTVLDRSPSGPEASSANAGTLAVQNKPLVAVPGAVKAVEAWAGLGQRLGIDVEYERRGGLRVAHDDQDVEKLERATEAQRAAGAPVEMIYQPQLAREAPYLAEDVQAASFCAIDGMANPFAAHRGFMQACRQAGATLRRGVTVNVLRACGHNEFVVETSEGPIRAHKVLVAAGAWNCLLAQHLGIDLEGFFEVQQALITDFAAPLFRHVVTHVRGNLTLKQQARSGKVLIGGAWPADGDLQTRKKRLRRESVIGNLARAVDTVPGIGATRLLRGWAGFEGRTPDRLLMAGPVGPMEGFHVLGCASGGFTFSPIAGWLAAQHLTGSRIEPEWRIFDATRLTTTTATQHPKEAS